MRLDRWLSPLFWALLAVLCQFGTVPEASAGVLRAEMGGVSRLESFETQPAWPVPPCRSVPTVSTDWRDATQLGTGFSATPRAPLPLALPPIDLPIADAPWQSPTTIEHLPERALALDSKIRIPEPASIVLLTTGLVGLFARRYLRRMHA